jgi:hypothetical protein
MIQFTKKYINIKTLIEKLFFKDYEPLETKYALEAIGLLHIIEHDQ